jgi:hypothetical protein
MIHTFQDDGRPFLVRLVKAGSEFYPAHAGPSWLSPPAAVDTVELYAQDDDGALLGTLLCRVPVAALLEGERYASSIEIPTARGQVRLYGYKWRVEFLPALGVAIPEDPPDPPVAPAPDTPPPTPSRTAADEAPF